MIGNSFGAISRKARLVLAVWVGLFLPGVALAVAKNPGGGEKVLCFVSILPQSFFVERIGGDHVTVRVMVGPGQAPHTFEPTGRQLAELSKARVYFSIGVAFERSLLPRIERNFRTVRVVDSAAGIPLRRADHDESENRTMSGERSDGSGDSAADERDSGTFDPHTWLSPMLGITIASNVRAALAELDPGNSAYYEGNYEALKKDLVDINGEIARTLAPYKGRKLFVYHPAYGYFTDAYGLLQMAIEERGGPPGPRHLAEIIDEAKTQGTRTIFIQPQISGTYAETVAKSVGARIVELDPLAANYDQNLLTMAREIAASFDQK